MKRGEVTERAGGRRCEALPGDLGERFPVDRVHECSPHPDVLQQRNTVVDPQPGKRRELLPALGRHADAGQLRQAPDVEVLDRAARQHVDAAGLEGRGAGSRIGNHMKVHVLDGWQAFDMVGVVADQLDE
ncbi:hypothetical protein D9M69_674500 [compost metagenome]